MAFDELIINYQTAPTVPPPYSFVCSVILKPGPKSLGIDFSQNYTDRDELDEEEITAEGFTLNDDFAWSGTLPEVWLSQFKALYSDTKWEHAPPEDGESPYVEVAAKNNGEAIADLLFPADITNWDYLLNEVMQATFEASEKENPFHMEFLDHQGGQKTHILVEASFVLRKVHVQSGEKKPVSWRWEVLREIFDLIYHQADFISENGLPNRPDAPGSYITAGDGLWYKLDEGIVNVSPKNRATKNIKELFERLKREL